ncbi:MAG: methyltransferase domain-containing protein [Defluviicoccus sp.]|nr:methyltransferase domain-containing protein [Defluviicoccus sp.]
MWSDVVELRNFYRSRMGGTAHRTIRDHVRAYWEDVTGMNVLGIGYPTPYLGQFRSEAERVLAVMPARQGVIRWPGEGSNLAALADEAELPLPDLSMDRVILVHALESAEQLRPMLREVWRVMADGGRMIAVVPNRTGIWARLDRTPFGHGHPYSQSQLSSLLRDAMFNPVAARYGLFVPPSRRRVLHAAAPAWERIGGRWFPRLGGVLIVEATKLIYAATPVAASGRRRVLAPQQENSLPAP